jgi:hypothetical protein
MQIRQKRHHGQLIREPQVIEGTNMRREDRDLQRSRAGRSLQIVHILGSRECPCASGAIASCIAALGARQGRRELRLCPFLGLFDRAWRWLAIDLCAD